MHGVKAAYNFISTVKLCTHFHVKIFHWPITAQSEIKMVTPNFYRNKSWYARIF